MQSPYTHIPNIGMRRISPYRSQYPIRRSRSLCFHVQTVPSLNAARLDELRQPLAMPAYLYIEDSHTSPHVHVYESG